MRAVQNVVHFIGEQKFEQLHGARIAGLFRFGDPIAQMLATFTLAGERQKIIFRDRRSPVLAWGIVTMQEFNALNSRPRGAGTTNYLHTQ